MKTKIVTVKLSEWFPSNDELATKMARLCILREELMFEFQCAIESRDVPIKDDYGQAWRQFYYFRKMFGTLQEIRSAIESLAKDANFKSFLNAQPLKWQKQFTQLKSKLESESEEIKTIRTEFGVHIKENIVREALLNMSHERWGFLHISQRPAKTHYKFSSELIMAIMLRNTPDNKQLRRAQQIVDVLTSTIEKLFPIIDTIFFGYTIDRKLANIHLH
jgi:YesN/AraC family two-component response regulator